MKKTIKLPSLSVKYNSALKGIVEIISDARRFSARTVNAVMTATYWEIGRIIVEFEQKGRKRAGYGGKLLAKLSEDLSARFGNGFSRQNLQRFRRFYLEWPIFTICPTALGISVKEKNSTALGISISSIKSQTVSAKLTLQNLSAHFLLPWSAYVSLLSIKDKKAREFYEQETLRGGWSVRQLNRQINSMFYERIALSRNKAKMLKKRTIAEKGDIITPEEEIKDPCVLEFLGLKDEYSESELEEALILHLENFLLELGDDFAFVGRQKRLRIGDEWYRADLIFFHRKLRCLVIVDLKIGKFTHADAGQMHMYLNFAKEHWTNKGENPPVGLILCARKDETLARYALKDLPNKVMAAEYRTVLPDERLLAAELKKTRALLENRVSGIKRKIQKNPGGGK